MGGCARLHRLHGEDEQVHRREEQEELVDDAPGAPGSLEGAPVDEVSDFVDLMGDAVLPIALDELLELLDLGAFVFALGHRILDHGGRSVPGHGTFPPRTRTMALSAVRRARVERTTRDAHGIGRRGRTRSLGSPSHSVRPLSPVRAVTFQCATPVSPSTAITSKAARTSSSMTTRPSVDDLIAPHPRLTERADPIDRVLREQVRDVDGIIQTPRHRSTAGASPRSSPGPSADPTPIH